LWGKKGCDQKNFNQCLQCSFLSDRIRIFYSNTVFSYLRSKRIDQKTLIVKVSWDVFWVHKGTIKYSKEICQTTVFLTANYWSFSLYAMIRKKYLHYRRPGFFENAVRRDSESSPFLSRPSPPPPCQETWESRDPRRRRQTAAATCVTENLFIWTIARLFWHVSVVCCQV